MDTAANTKLRSTDAETRRTAAVWVAGTGAVLLLLAAGAFIAVSWDRLPDVAKMAAVGALTAGFLVGGRRLRPTLPATGDVLFHLGALLLPVDLAGLNLRLGLGWRHLVLAEGLLAVAAFPALARWTGSVVMRWAALASVPLLVTGIALVSPVPAAALLAAGAAAALAAGHRHTAVVWAVPAGAGPLVALAAAGGAGPATGLLEDLGLAGGSAAIASVVAGGLAGLVLAVEADRRRDLGLAALAGSSVATGAAAGYVAADPGPVSDTLALPVAFVILEMIALLARRDGFWGRPLHAVAALGELLVGVVGGGIAALVVLSAPALDLPTGPAVEGAAGLAFGVAGLGWLLAGWRRLPDVAVERSADDIGDEWAVALASLMLVAGVAVGTASALATAVALAVAAAVLTGSARPAEGWAGAAAGLWAPVVVAVSHAPVAPAFGVFGAAAIATGAAVSVTRRRTRRPAASDVVLATAAVAAAAAGWVGAATGGLPAAVAALAFVATCAAVGVILDRGGPVLGDVARWSTLAASVAVPWLPSGSRILVAVAPVVLLAVEAVRKDRPHLAAGAAAAVHVVTVHAALDAGLDVATSGLVVTVSAVVWAGLAAVTDTRWQHALTSTAVAAVLTGVPLAAADPQRLGQALVVTGLLAVAAGALARRPALGHAGGVIGTAGIWILLGEAGVSEPEAHLAPVAAQLVVLGVQLRRRDDSVSSWLAYGPAIALLGGAALVERLSGASGWHAVMAGAVGLVAVVVGGWARLAAPLVLGTALLAAVAVHESLPALVGVPTWGWLAAAGATLLAAGVLLERSGLTPAESGRRLVDVVAERFA